MKKLLYSLLLSSLVSSAMAVSEQQILNLVRSTGNNTEFNKLLENIDMNEVQKTAEDLMYDISGDAAQLLISRMIKELRQKKRYHETGVSKEEQDLVSREQAKALNAGIEAMGRDLKKLEDGTTDPKQLETEAGKAALEKAVPLAMGNKIADALGLLGVASSAAGLTLIGTKAKKLHDGGVSIPKSLYTSLTTPGTKETAAALGTVGGAGLYYGLKHTRRGRKIARHAGRAVNRGINWVKRRPYTAAGTVIGALGGLGGYHAINTGLKERTGVGLAKSSGATFVENLAGLSNKDKAKDLAVAEFIKTYKTDLGLLVDAINSHDQFMSKDEHKLGNIKKLNAYVPKIKSNKSSSPAALEAIKKTHQELVKVVKKSLEESDKPGKLTKPKYKASDMAQADGYTDENVIFILASDERAKALELCKSLDSSYTFYLGDGDKNEGLITKLEKETGK